MLKQPTYIIVFLMVANWVIAQQHPLQIFNNLMGKIWVAQGKWDIKFLEAQFKLKE